MNFDVIAPGGYEVSASSDLVSISNRDDDSSGATELEPADAIWLGALIVKAAAVAIELRRETGPRIGG